MTQKDNIVQELLDLKSELAGISRQTVFQVPSGYFDALAGEILKKVSLLEAGDEAGETGLLSSMRGNDLSKQHPFQAPAGYFDHLPEEILKRVKASVPENAVDELFSLSPLLSKISRQTPYTVPAGYFADLEQKLEPVFSSDKNPTAQQELETLSPLLSGLKKQSTYTVPEGYFETLVTISVKENKSTETKVISMTARKWFRYAAAALVIGFVATVGFLLLNKSGDSINPTDKSFAWVQKNLKKVSTDDLDEFVELASAGTPDVLKADAMEDINNLLKDVSDKEIQDFLNDAQTAEPENDDNLILN